MDMLADVKAMNEFRLNRAKTLGMAFLSVAVGGAAVFLAEAADAEAATPVIATVSAGAAAMSLGAYAGYAAGRGSRRKHYLEKYNEVSHQIIAGELRIDEFYSQERRQITHVAQQDHKKAVECMEVITGATGAAMYGTASLGGLATLGHGAVYFNSLATSNQEQMNTSGSWFLGGLLITGATFGIGKGFSYISKELGKWPRNDDNNKQ